MQVLASRHKPHPITSRTAKAALLPAATEEGQELDVLEASAHCGCGWFDSSYDLNTGLQVTEDQDPSLLQLWARVLNGPMTRH
jgi:hypothetical protein